MLQHSNHRGPRRRRQKERIIGVPEEEDKKKDHEKILEEIVVENFPKIGKEIATQV